MIRFLLCAILLCATLLCGVVLPASWAVAATVYIDPTCTNNGNGTLGTPCAASGGGAGPRNTWVGVNWTAGNTYAGRGGTIANVTNLIIRASGTNGNPITLTSYGTGRHTLQGVGSYAIASIDQSYLTIKNLHISSDTSHGIYFSSTGASSNLIVTNCLLSNIAGSGIKVGDKTDASVFSHISITTNTFDTIGHSAIDYGFITVGNSATWDTHIITDNTFTNIGTTATNSAIIIGMEGGTTAHMTNVSIARNSISKTNLFDTNPGFAIALMRSPAGSGIENRFSGVTISDNHITTTRAGTIYLGSAASPSSISRNTITNIDANAAIAVFNSDSVVVEQNVISGVRPLAESHYIDGMGLDLEFSKNLIIRRNSISNNLGNVAGNASGGQGIYVVGNIGTLVAGNLMSGNKNGLVIDGGIGGGASTVSNNTVVNSTNCGIWASPSYTQGNILINNIVYGNASWGIYDEGAGTKQTSKNNLFLNNRGGNYGNRSAGLHDVLADPGFMSATDFRLKLDASPAHLAGSIDGSCVDFYGRVCWAPPDIGAFQFSSDSSPSAPVGLKIEQVN